jgi:hypothetical protein
VKTNRRARRPEQKQLKGSEAPTENRPRRDPRFRQLLQLAKDGNAEAVADLWREFGYRLGKGAA